MARKSNFDREEKLIVAMDLFWKKGYSNTAISDLIDTLKINRFSLYNAYGDKKTLYYEALDKYLVSVPLPRLAELNQTNSAFEELTAFLKEFVKLQKTSSSGCFMQNALIEHAGQDEYVLAKGQQLFDQLLAVISHALRNAQEQKQIGTLLDANQLAKLVLVQMQGIRVMGKAKRYDDINAALESLLILLKGNAP
ncbi:MAG: TetR/AcrR family transcriptional regulator [Vibrio anguillarum]